MNLKKTKWYPVDPTGQVIYIDPMDRAGDVVTNRNKWLKRFSPCVMWRGSDLMASMDDFAGYRVIPTVTRESVLAEWREEEGRSKYLWQGAACIIADTIESHDPQTALEALKRMVRETRPMAICAFYMRAVEDMKTVIDQQAQAS